MIFLLIGRMIWNAQHVKTSKTCALVHRPEHYKFTIYKTKSVCNVHLKFYPWLKYCLHEDTMFHTHWSDYFETSTQKKLALLSPCQNTSELYQRHPNKVFFSCVTNQKRSKEEMKKGAKYARKLYIC